MPEGPRTARRASAIVFRVSDTRQKFRYIVTDRPLCLTYNFFLSLSLSLFEGKTNFYPARDDLTYGILFFQLSYTLYLFIIFWSRAFYVDAGVQWLLLECGFQRVWWFSTFLAFLNMSYFLWLNRVVKLKFNGTNFNLMMIFSIFPCAKFAIFELVETGSRDWSTYINYEFQNHVWITWKISLHFARSDYTVNVNWLMTLNSGVTFVSSFRQLHSYNVVSPSKLWLHLLKISSSATHSSSKNIDSRLMAAIKTKLARP